MISALFFVFLLQLLIHLINTVGKQRISDALWNLYTQLPLSNNTSTSASSLSELRREVVRLNRELTATSAQDEFAKWAKLRRQHDKAKAQYETLSRDQSNTQATFNTAVSVLRFLGTQGLQFGCNFYFSTQPMFWLPMGWVPKQVEWLLCFPRAPMGSVSVNVWTVACACVIGLVSQGVVAMWTLGSGEVKEGENKGEKIKMEGLAAKSGKSGSREKKEL